MAAQFSDRIRNAWLDSNEAITGVSPKLRIYPGSRPTNCAASATGTLLAEITCPSDWMAAVSSGAKVLAGSWTVAAIAAGTAGYYRLYDNAATNCDEQGTITATGGGGDMTVDNTSIASGQTVTITAKTLTAGGA